MQSRAAKSTWLRKQKSKLTDVSFHHDHATGEIAKQIEKVAELT